MWGVPCDSVHENISASYAHSSFSVLLSVVFDMVFHLGSVGGNCSLKSLLCLRRRMWFKLKQWNSHEGRTGYGIWSYWIGDPLISWSCLVGLRFNSPALYLYDMSYLITILPCPVCPLSGFLFFYSAIDLFNIFFHPILQIVSRQTRKFHKDMKTISVEFWTVELWVGRRKKIPSCNLLAFRSSPLAVYQHLCQPYLPLDFIRS